MPSSPSPAFEVSVPHRESRWRAVQRGLATVLVAVVAVLVPACSSAASTASDSNPRALTGAESERLAIFRFNAYQMGMVAVRGTVVGDQSVTINGWIDTADGKAYALIDAPDAAHPGAFLSEWNAQQISAQDYTGSTAPLPPPETGWETTTLDPSTSTLAAAQALLVSLSSDRPDNAQLLVQNGARWLGTGTVNGTVVDIMSGPVADDSAGADSSFRYWIDKDGNLLRVQALLDGLHLSTFDFSAAPGVTF